MKTAVTLFLPLLAATGPLIAQDDGPTEVEQRIAALEEKYRATYEREIGFAFDVQVAELDGKYVAALQREMEAAIKAVNLDEAVLFRDEIARVKEGAALPEQDPDDTPKSLRALHGTYRQQLASLGEKRDRAAAPIVARFDKMLEAYQDDLTRGAKLDEALAVKHYRESGLLERLTGAPPAPASSTDAPDAPPPPKNPVSPEQRAEAISDLIDWALHAKYEFAVRQGEETKFLRDTAELPDRDFELVAIRRNHTFSIHPPTPFPWKAVARVPELEALVFLRPAAPIQADDLAQLAGAEKLQKLELDAAQFAENAFDGLPDLPNLQSFSIHFGRGFQEDWIATLRAKCPNLKRLFLSFNATPFEWSPDHYRALAQWSELEALTLQGTGSLHAEDSRTLGSLENLKHICFFGAWSADPEAIAALDDWPELDSIHIRSKALLPLLPEFLKLRRLERLNLTHGGLEDEHLAAIAAHAGSHLKILHIGSNPKLTDTGIAHLETLGRLETLHVGRAAPGITEAGVADLRKRLRRCKIHY